ncbi:hypothetical protein DFP72DRAFT_818908 [Ephemerocybe angulata]|uniref:Uncharacterized protein n=1 Tax=Ephemerocybe angulata TaxID=980116 RepID=A0A8H6HMY9_9AGAR|nr:hypothetical protein DFP72DRAFT_818908 [Tulosesus angulatus]
MGGNSVDTTSGSSVLRPACPCEERFWRWTPARRESEAAPSMDTVKLLCSGYATSTLSTYSSGVAALHTFCDMRVPRVPELERAPLSESLLLEFIAACAGQYSGSTVANYVFGIEAWHNVHRVPWRIPKAVVSLALRAANNLAPPPNAPRPPVTIETMSAVLAHLDLSLPLDAAVWACMTTTYWSISRLGEFVLKSAAAVKEGHHVKRCDMDLDRCEDRNATTPLYVTTFFIPSTKSSKIKGETTQWAAQRGPCDPRAAMLNHLQINEPARDAHLFTYRNPKTRKLVPLTRAAFLTRVNTALAAGSHSPIKGHCLRIGGVLEWLLRGLSFEVVKVMGRWASDAFIVYLRKRSAVLAPYIQASPVFVPFTQMIAMPTRIR